MRLRRKSSAPANVIVIALVATFATACEPAQSVNLSEARLQCGNRQDSYRIRGCSALIAGTDDEATLAAAFNNRGNAYRDQGNHGRAIADYNQAIRINPQLAASFNNRCLAHLDLGDYSRAVLDCSEALRLDPNFAEALINRGNTYTHRREYERAFADYDHAIRLKPSDPDGYLGRAATNYYRGDFAAAISDYNEALQLDPKNAKTLRSRDLAMHAQGKMDRAAKAR